MKKITVDASNTSYKVVQDCLIDVANKKLIQGLATGVIPQDGSVTSLSPYCFDHMPIISVTVPNGVTEIPDNAFSNSKLTTISLPNTLKTLGATCFAWCHDLSEIDLPEGLTDILTYVFFDCRSIEELVLPSTINTILECAFCDTKSLNSITFTANGNGNIPSINHNAFNNAGSAEFSINVPWTLNEHLQTERTVTDDSGTTTKVAGFVGTYTDTNGIVYDKDIFFGAKVGSKLVFADGITITKELSIENGNRFREAN